jgi:hypothetical protein
VLDMSASLGRAAPRPSQSRARSPIEDQSGDDARPHLPGPIGGQSLRRGGDEPRADVAAVAAESWPPPGRPAGRSARRRALGPRRPGPRGRGARGPRGEREDACAHGQMKPRRAHRLEIPARRAPRPARQARPESTRSRPRPRPSRPRAPRRRAARSPSAGARPVPRSARPFRSALVRSRRHEDGHERQRHDQVDAESPRVADGVPESSAEGRAQVPRRRTCWRPRRAAKRTLRATVAGSLRHRQPSVRKPGHDRSLEPDWPELTPHGHAEQEELRVQHDHRGDENAGEVPRRAATPRPFGPRPRTRGGSSAALCPGRGRRGEPPRRRRCRPGRRPPESGSRASAPRTNARRAGALGSSGGGHWGRAWSVLAACYAGSPPGHVIVIGGEIDGGQAAGTDACANGEGTPGGSKLRGLRERARRTQLWVELEAELGAGYLQRVESGRSPCPSG